MKNFAKVAVLFSAFLLPAVLFARVIPHHDAGVQITVPDNWTQEIDGDLLMMNDPGEEALLMFLVVEAEQIEDALSALETELENIVTDAEMEDPQERTLNGMQAIVADGYGMAEGENVQLGVAVVKTPKNKALIVIGIVLDEAASKHQSAIEQAIRSIKPIR